MLFTLRYPIRRSKPRLTAPGARVAVDIQCHIFIFCDRGHLVKSLKRNIFAAGDMAVSVFFRGTDIQQDSTRRGQIFLYALIDIGLLEEI